MRQSFCSFKHVSLNNPKSKRVHVDDLESNKVIVITAHMLA